MLRPARPLHQEAVLVFLALPEPAHAAMIAVLLPKRGVDVAFGVERRDEFIPMPR
jgi:hypothetical protein